MFGNRRNDESDEASEWDSPSEATQGGPKIEGSSADEKPVRDTTGKRPIPSERNIKSPKHHEPQNSGRQPEGRAKKSAKENTKPKDPMGGFTFTDRGGDSAEEESVSISISQSQPNKSKKRVKKRQKEENPPYDFKGAITDANEHQPPSSRPPGKDRKGNTYDPSPRPPTAASGDTVALDSWDDSEAEERVLAELRQDLKKENTTIDVEPEDQHQKSGSSFKSLKKLGSKLSQRLKKSPRHQANTSQEVLVEDIPEQDITSPLHHFQAVVKDDGDDEVTKEKKQIKKERKVKKVMQHTDPDDNKYVYYFEDTSTEYYAATPDEVDASLPKIADKAEKIMRRVALEFFGVLRLIIGFFIIFVVELYRFVMRHIIHPVVVGILTVTGDYLIKPILSAIFNGILQPVSIFLYNLFVALHTGLSPLIDIINGFARQVAVILGAFRLVVVTNTHNHYDRHVQDV